MIPSKSRETSLSFRIQIISQCSQRRNSELDCREVAMILTDVQDSADARQRVNEEFPSPTIHAFSEYNFGSCNAITEPQREGKLDKHSYEKRSKFEFRDPVAS